MEREPRLHGFELAKAAKAGVVDFGTVDRLTRPSVKLARPGAGLRARVAAHEPGPWREVYG